MIGFLDIVDMGRSYGTVGPIFYKRRVVDKLLDKFRWEKYLLLHEASKEVITLKCYLSAPNDH